MALHPHDRKPSVATSCTDTTTAAMPSAERREAALSHFYAAERNAGTDADTAFERMTVFGKWLDERGG